MKKKFMLVVQHSTDDLEKSNAAIALALSLLSVDAEVSLFFIFQGALLAKKGVAESIHGKHLTPIADMWPELLNEDVPMFVCGACVKTYNITEEELVPGIKIVQLPTLAAKMMECETITF